MGEEGQSDNQRNYFNNGGEEEGTGGDGGYNQNAVSAARNQDYSPFFDEGANAPVVGGIVSDNFEEEK